MDEREQNPGDPDERDHVAVRPPTNAPAKKSWERPRLRKSPVAEVTGAGAAAHADGVGSS